MDNLEELKKEIRELQSKLDKLENQKKEEKKRWRAKAGNKYFYVDDFGIVESTQDKEYNSDDYRYETRNYFKTKEEAEEYQEVINTYYDLMDLADELNDGRKIEWNDENQCKYFIYYDCGNDTLEKTCAMKWKYLGQIYCLDKKFKDKAIEKIGEDRLKNLFKYERR